MKNTRIIALLLVGVLGLGGVIVSACSGKGAHKEETNISHYTCPMHPQVHKDHPGECPICGMDLVPVQKNPPQPPFEKGGQGGISITPERQQLIGLKTSMTQRGPASKSIRTVGRVAFDPELAVAQREYLEIAKNVPTLKESSRSRLRLLGMSDQEIKDLERRGSSSNLYLPKPGDSVWVYATLFQGEFDLVKPGLTAEISLPSGSRFSYPGTVRAVDPIVDPMTRSARARIEVPGAGGVLKPDTYVNVSLKIDLGEALTIPKSALIDTGTRKVAFVVHGGTHFETRNVQTGPEEGDDVVILDGLQEGETVVTSSAFLVDSESQLKAAVSGMGEHRH